MQYISGIPNVGGKVIISYNWLINNFLSCIAKNLYAGLNKFGKGLLAIYISTTPPPTGGDIVFGSVVFVVVYVIPCEHDNFWGVLNIIFKLEPCINHIKVLDEKTGELDHDLKGQIGLETSNILVLIFFFKFVLEFYLQTWTVYWSSKCLTWVWKLVTLIFIFKVKLGFKLSKFEF